ncbi:MAG TPA: hypothetical protein VFP84_24280 [Kofleriaceae bacterium]|nr:hypothetical protein [Kofleriaceae bacterium]
MLVLSTVLAAACAGTLDPMPKPTSGIGAKVDAPGQRAEEHDKLARPEVAAADSYTCGDTVMSDQVTTGGKPLTWATPCWDTGEEKIAHEEYMTQLAAERAEADQSRSDQADNRLVADEQRACAGLSQHEIEHSVFSHRREIAEVIPHREGDTLRGVRIVWKKVPGLTASWMRQSIACHRAQFERLGEPSIYFPKDPTLVAKANVTVEEHAGHLEVLVETSDAPASQLALDRANELIHPKAKTATAVR